MSPTDPPRVLCAGDLHLGRRPSRLPAEADPRTLSTAAVWLRTVRLAVEREVGLVLLSGDLVESANRYFEAFDALERGVRELLAAGAEVCAVAGNHDHEVLPRLARRLRGGGFHLLGEGGRWERFTWTGEGGRPLLHVDGWSFAAPRVREDPTDAYALERPADGAPVIGLLHADLDQAGSDYAPARRAGLERIGVAAWVLGHVHRPGVVELAGGRWALYPGSPQPLDPGETGIHGPWLIELAAAGPGPPRQVPLATLRYEPLPVDLSAVAALDEAEDRITARVGSALGEILDSDAGAPAWVLFRLVLEGRTDLHPSMARLLERLRSDPPTREVGGVRGRVESAWARTRPRADVEALARGEGPPGVLARLLQRLEAGDGIDPELQVELEATRQEVLEHRPYVDLGGELPGPRSLLAAAAWDLLDRLLEQRSGRS